MPLPLVAVIGAALAGFAFGALVAVAILKWEDIINWFSKRDNLLGSDKKIFAFTLQERLKTGEYKTIKGIFDKRTDEVLDAEAVQSKEIDDKLAEVHRNKKLVFYKWESEKTRIIREKLKNGDYTVISGTVSRDALKNGDYTVISGNTVISGTFTQKKGKIVIRK